MRQLVVLLVGSVSICDAKPLHEKQQWAPVWADLELVVGLSGLMMEGVRQA
jgi:hypothetical protein